MTQYQFIIALMIFLIAYGLFEVPSNILLKKYRPSRWIAFLMFSWGAVTIGLGGVQAFWSVTFVRFLLGVFEAGLFPGLVYYISKSMVFMLGFVKNDQPLTMRPQPSGTVPRSEVFVLP